ncbi:integrase arm-type DNA-binding domain-containing protein [Methylocystis sp.]|uniref:tyrosine-type recombinase/integrase n=1 Tax=Methylocystis sp. TaxID=1911079 RepID=UPI0027354ACB|nr:integrase arm-type DNA-binding domain-containing protein [Methylocystis sp.]MDP3553076.1 tyrosine-type recombinase/integrase [Methylocystis sp.]
MPLTELQIRNAKPGEKLIKLSDGGGLQLWITPEKKRYWRYAYRFDCKQKVYAIGVYPDVGLKAAREARDKAKQLLAQGRDPTLAKKLCKAASANSSGTTFQALADEFLQKKTTERKARKTLAKLQWLIGIALPSMGSRQIDELSPREVLAVLRTVEVRGQHETARRLRAVLSEVFRYAIATDRAESDPTIALKGALIAPKVRHRAAFVDAQPFGTLLRAIDGYQGQPETRIALQLLALTFVRSGELRNADWNEFDLEKAVWSIPPGRMKMKRAHRVPLAPQAVALLEELRSISLGRGPLLFPGQRSAERPISENTFNAALRRLGYGKEEVSAHGFRATACSMLNESGLWSVDAVERQLAHVESNNVRRAYARADYWDERVRMMAWWAKRCDEMRSASGSAT